MTIPRRQRRITGRHALVDGIPFRMPIDSVDTAALMALFPIDADAAAKLMPGGEIHPFRLLNGRGVLVVTVVDYRTTDIGSYIEFSIAIACTHGTRPAPRLLPALLRRTFGTGQFVVDLPVSTEISVKGGKGIWGMPKHQANLDFSVTEQQVSSQYDLDGKLAMRIEIDRPTGFRLPLRIGAVNYCQYRGMLMKSYVYFKGRAGFKLSGPARLFLGDHPRMDPLRDLDISTKTVATAFLSETYGVLDDYYESWFVTYEKPAAEKPEGFESVIDLGLGQDWLPPPKAPY
ncbi:MAG: acetoacetate decarboxylase family protein [Actinomycetota bacterium]